MACYYPCLPYLLTLHGKIWLGRFRLLGNLKQSRRETLSSSILGWPKYVCGQPLVVGLSGACARALRHFSCVISSVRWGEDEMKGG